MSNHSKVRIALICFLILAWWQEWPWYVWVIPVLIYLILVTLGSSIIGLNFYTKALCRVKYDPQRRVCLTFDDGPDPETTPRILDILIKHDSKAAFFLIGKKISGQEDLVKRMVSEGHLLGNHSYNHQHSFPAKPSAVIGSEIRQTNEEIKRATGLYPKVFRPPFGVTSPPIAEAVRKTGVTVLGWNIRSFDTKRHPAEQTAGRVLKALEPGSVILLHDTVPETAEVLEILLPGMKKLGYSVILPDQLFNIPWYETA